MQVSRQWGETTTQELIILLLFCTDYKLQRRAITRFYATAGPDLSRLSPTVQTSPSVTLQKLQRKENGAHLWRKNKDASWRRLLATVNTVLFITQEQQLFHHKDVYCHKQHAKLHISPENQYLSSVIKEKNIIKIPKIRTAKIR